jgi:hypothetical protein
MEMVTAPVAEEPSPVFLGATPTNLAEGSVTLMTVRRPDANRNSGDANSEMSDTTSRGRKITLRDAVIGLIGLLVGVAAGILAFMASRSLPGAILASVPACIGAIKILDTLID